MVRNKTRGSLPEWEKPVDQGSNPSVPTPRPRDVGKEPPSSKTQPRSPIRGSALTKASCGRAKWSGRGHAHVQSDTESPVRSRCNHSEVEDLGSGGIVEFYRCTGWRDCGVGQGRRRWAGTG